MPKNTRHHHSQQQPRRRIQRAFIAWLYENKHRFCYQPQIHRRTDRIIEMSFAGIHPAVTVILARGIDIPVMRRNECVDLLASFETDPARDATGYYCTLCAACDRQYFATREALWVAEIFEPFLDWVNDQLADANFLEIFETPGITFAKLHNLQPDAFCLPLKTLPK